MFSPVLFSCLRSYKVAFEICFGCIIFNLCTNMFLKVSNLRASVASQISETQFGLSPVGIEYNPQPTRDM